MSAMTPIQGDDGRWYRFEGYDTLGKPVRIEVEPPVREFEAIAPEPVPESPLAVMAGGLGLPAKGSVDRMKKGLLYREPKADGTYGKWYQSIWFWFWVVVTAFFTRWWISVSWGSMYDSTGGYSGDPDAGDYVLTLFGWVWWGWMPLGIGAIGALQAAGYKRLAVAWSVTITALIAAYFARNNRSRT